MKIIKPFNGLDFPLWKEKVEDILKFLDLDYVLHKAKPSYPTPVIEAIEDRDEKMYEYHFKLEIWEKDNKFAKRIMKSSISTDIRERFYDTEDRTACEFLYSVEHLHKHVCVKFLLNKLTTSRYDGQSGLAKHRRFMWYIACELQAFGMELSDSSVEFWINESLRDP